MVKKYSKEGKSKSGRCDSSKYKLGSFWSELFLGYIWEDILSYMVYSIMIRMRLMNWLFNLDLLVLFLILRGMLAL